VYNLVNFHEHLAENCALSPTLHPFQPNQALETRDLSCITPLA
jgi:hypothetical protein